MNSRIYKNLVFFIWVMYAVTNHKGLIYTQDALVGPISLLVLLFVCFKDTQLVYQKRLVHEKREYWRLVSSHFTHLNDRHLYMNIAGLFLMWVLFGYYYTTGSYWLVVILCIILCSLETYWSNCHQCSGLSGILMGLFVFGIGKGILADWKFAYVLLCILIYKTGKEIFVGTKEMDEYIEGKVAVNSHLCGIVGGLLALGMNLCDWG